MSASFAAILQQVLIYLVYALMGILLVKVKVLDASALPVISRLLTKLCIPLVVFTSILGGTHRQDVLEALPMLAAVLVLYGVLYLAGEGTARLMKVTGHHKPVFRAAMVFGNLGFMGIPLLTAVYPQRGALYGSLFLLVDQALMWSVGVYAVNFTPVKPVMKERLKKLINPCIIAMMLAFVGVMLNVQLPAFLFSALKSTAATATPLSMIYLGGLFMTTSIKGYLTRKELLPGMLIKLVVIPVALYWVLGFLPYFNPEMRMCMTLMTGMPCFVALSLVTYGDQEAAAYGGTLTITYTILCLATLPLVSAICTSLLG